MHPSTCLSSTTSSMNPERKKSSKIVLSWKEVGTEPINLLKCESTYYYVPSPTKWWYRKLLKSRFDPVFVIIARPRSLLKANCLGMMNFEGQNLSPTASILGNMYHLSISFISSLFTCGLRILQLTSIILAQNRSTEQNRSRIWKTDPMSCVLVHFKERALSLLMCSALHVHLHQEEITLESSMETYGDLNAVG